MRCGRVFVSLKDGSLARFSFSGLSKYIYYEQKYNKASSKLALQELLRFYQISCISNKMGAGLWLVQSVYSIDFEKMSR